MMIPLTGRLPALALAVVLAVGTGVGVMASQGGDHGRSESAPGHGPQLDNHEPGETPREIKGIPDENPNHQPADSDGECEKGETVEKTTPAGTRVNVPCQAADHNGIGHGAANQHQDDESD